MIYVNNFRYGKISKKMAGRFDSEQYNQGAFTFRNVRAIFEGGVTRRPPLRHLATLKNSITSYVNGVNEKLTLESTDSASNWTERSSKIKIYVMKGFTVNSKISYLLCLGTRTYGTTTNEPVYVYYSYKTSSSGYEFKLIGIGTLKEQCKNSVGYVTPSESEFTNISFSQYYDRMYVASSLFPAFYFHYDGNSISPKNCDFVFLKDIKKSVKQINPNSNRTDKGKIVFPRKYKNGDTETTRYFYTTLYDTLENNEVKLNEGETYASIISDVSESYVTGFNDFEDNTFNDAKDNYPSIVAVINDCLWFANTKNKPNAIWKSRVLGSSQWIEGYSADTMHDFSPCQVVSTEKAVLYDQSEWPLAPMKDSSGKNLYYQYGGADMWYSRYDSYTLNADGTAINRGTNSYDLDPINKKFKTKQGDTVLYYSDSEGDIYYKYDDLHRLIREPKNWVKYGAGQVYKYTKWYKDEAHTTIQDDVLKRNANDSFPDEKTLNTEWTTKDNGPRQYYVAKKKDGTDDTDSNSYKKGISQDGLYWYDGTYYWSVTKQDAVEFETYGLAKWWNNYDWYWYAKQDSAGNKTYYSIGSNNSNFKCPILSQNEDEPTRHKYETYDFTNETLLYKNVIEIDVVATDSCALRFELNTGRTDAIRFIKTGCDKIVIGTTNAEWTLPSGFNAVSNNSASKYSGYGSLVHEPIELNRSLIFLQRGKLLREFYLYQSYIMQRDIMQLNHDAVGSSDVTDTISKNAPDPTIYLVRKDGTILYGMYDADAGLNSFADWDMEGGYKFKGVSLINRGEEEVVISLVNKGEGNSEEQYICYFDEHEQDLAFENQNWADQITDTPANTNPTYIDYNSEIETSYIEINNQSIMFGRNKKTKGVWIRPYQCGRIRVGNDDRQLTITNYELKDTDYHATVTGKADMAFSMWIKSYFSEPMNILAFAWEVES